MTVHHAVLSREYLREIPAKPGVYLMVDQGGRVLYVGKARHLRKRLASYQRFLVEQHTKTGVLLQKVVRIETFLTHTEKEALILEASLIKKHRPRYNVILRDDKNYPYLKVTVTETWPRLLVSRRRINDGSRYFGPYSSATAMRNTLRYMNKLFPLRRCNDKDLKKRTRPCLNQQMGRCFAPCAGLADSQKYQEMVADLVLALEGRNRSLLAELRNRMTVAAESLEFEAAAGCRDQISAITQTLEKQVVVSRYFRDQDVIGLSRDQGSAAVSVVFVREGIVNGQLSFFLPEALDEDAPLLSQVVEQLYGDGQPLPDEVLLPFEPEAPIVLSEWLTELKGSVVKIKIPQRGEGVQLLEMARQNSRQCLAEKINQDKTWENLSIAIARELKLNAPPERFMCLDISNTGGQLAVGALVCFCRGTAEKESYRHYRIRQVEGPDDYGMISEVLGRFFSKSDREQVLHPDLFLIDGGRGQLTAALKAMEFFGQKIELAALAKGRDRGVDRIFRPGRKNPIVLAPHSPVLLFFMRMRDEAHRFGITFHRRLRDHKTLGSALDTIAGIGPVKKRALLQFFGSFTKIMNASQSELAEAPGIGPELAREIRSSLDSATAKN